MTRRAALLAALVVLPSVSCHRGAVADRMAADLPAGWGATFRCALQRGEEVQRFRLTLGARPPDRFRLEIYGPVGGPRLVAASDGRRLTAAVPGERLHAEADPTPQAFEALLGLPLPAGDLLALLEGSPGASDRGGRAGGNEIDYTPRRQGGELVAVTLEIRRPGAPPVHLQVDYDDFRVAAGRRLPHEIRLQGPHAALALSRRETIAGGPIDAALRIALPPGFQEVDLGRLGSAGVRLFGAPG